MPIFLHPLRVPIGSDRQMDQYKLDELVGRPFDTAMALTRMILSGLFDRSPAAADLRRPHGRRPLPVMGRLDFGWRLGYEGMPERARIRCKELPSSYLQSSARRHHGRMGAACAEAVEVFGPDRVMFGTDYGPVPVDPKQHVDMVKGLETLRRRHGEYSLAECGEVLQTRSPELAFVMAGLVPAIHASLCAK